MKIGIMQPYFFPYIGYWQLMNAVDKYVIYDDVNFIKGGWINRNRIKSNGQIQFIRLQMNGASSNKLINEIDCVMDEITCRKILTTIEMSYSKAQYFNEIMPIVSEIINYKEKNLAKYLENSIVKIHDALEMKSEIIISSDIPKDVSLHGQDKVINICKCLEGDVYYNAIGGQQLYDSENFLKNGIKLKFVQSQDIEYHQMGGEYDSYLSIIDMLMNEGLEKTKTFLFCYNLIE